LEFMHPYTMKRVFLEASLDETFSMILKEFGWKL